MNRQPVAVLVVGMHRAGTSAITRTLNLMGAALPSGLLPPSPTENPTGFWEAADIVACHDRFLAAVGSSWDDPRPLPGSAFTSRAATECRDRLVDILHRDLDGASLFTIKDPRLSRLLPLWGAVLASFGARPMAVLPVRDPGAVALSLHRRNGFSREKSLALWLSYALAAERDSRGWLRVFASYDAFIQAPDQEARRLAGTLGCFSPAIVEAAMPEIGRFWSRDLRHHGSETASALPSWGQEVAAWYGRAAIGDEPMSQDLDTIGNQVERALEIYGSLLNDGDPAQLIEARERQTALAAENEDLRTALAEAGRTRQALDDLREGFETQLLAVQDALRTNQPRWFDYVWSAVTLLPHLIVRGGFDRAFYLASNPDVVRSGGNPFIHYVRHGHREGRAPNPGRGGSALSSVIPSRRKGDGKCVVMALHNLGGGVERHCTDMERLLEDQGVQVWRLTGLGDGIWRLGHRAGAVEHTYRGAEEEMLAALAGLHPDLIHVHHLIGFGGRLREWLQRLGIPYDVTIHDYAFHCPRVNMLDGKNRFCGDNRSDGDCERCLKREGAHPHLQTHYDRAGGIAEWRAEQALSLAGARRVYAPDPDVIGRFGQQFPGIEPVLRPHPEPHFSIPVPPPARGGCVRVAVIGSIGPHKGFERLLACARAARRDRLKLTFVVIGDVSDPRRLAGLDTIEVTGRYKDRDLPNLIERAGCHAALFLSQWPETYMYTLTSALRAGLYPIVFDLGAPARRVRELGWGEVLPRDVSVEDVNHRLMELALNHPFPDSAKAVGHDYGSILETYYGLV